MTDNHVSNWQFAVIDCRQHLYVGMNQTVLHSFYIKTVL